MLPRLVLLLLFIALATAHASVLEQQQQQRPQHQQHYHANPAAFFTNFSALPAAFTLSEDCEHCDKSSRNECNQMWPNATSFGVIDGVGLTHTTRRIDPSWSACGANASSGHLVWSGATVLYGNFTTVARWFPGPEAAVASATGFIGLDSPDNVASITLGFHGEGSPQTGTGKHGFQLGCYRNLSRSHHQHIVSTTEDLSASFNVFNVLWTPSEVVWSINGREVYSMDKFDDVPDQPMMLRLDSRSGWIDDELFPPGASFDATILSFEYAPLATT